MVLARGTVAQLVWWSVTAAGSARIIRLMGGDHSASAFHSHLGPLCNQVDSPLLHPSSLRHPLLMDPGNDLELSDAFVI